MIKNHVLGTTQFGKKNYGISNFSNELKKEKKIQKILEQAWNFGIRNYDTAPSYGTEKLLGKFIKKKKIQKKIKIITKISNLKQNTGIFSQIKKSIKLSLKKLNMNKIHYLLFHNQKDYSLILKEKNLFNKIKNEFNIENIGFSVYDVKVAKKILKTFPKVALQFPYNVCNTSFAKITKKNNIFFGRSIFLQGLLISDKIKKGNSNLQKSHKNFVNFIKQKNINPLKLCLDHAFSNKKLDYIIYGVTSLSELKEIIQYNPKKFINKKLENKIKSFFTTNNKDPRNWI